MVSHTEVYLLCNAILYLKDPDGVLIKY